MKSYKLLEDVSLGIAKDINLYDTNEIKNLLKERVPILFKALADDLRQIFGKEFMLKQYHLFVDDDTYRQGATGLIFALFVQNDKDFIIRVECLIDYGNIWIKIKGASHNEGMNTLINKLKKQENHNGIDLKEIQL